MNQNDDLKLIAFQRQLNVPADELEDIDQDGDRFSYGGEEWLVFTDSEAEQAFEAALEDYVQECVLDVIPAQYRSYFDFEMYIRDIRLSDGRGAMLASYNGAEEEQRVEGEWIYLYRIG